MMSRTRTDVELIYSIFCDDVRLEVGNKLSAMGIFQNIFAPQLPITLIKFAVLSHWSGHGQHLCEVRLLGPDRMSPIAISPPTRFQIPPDGFADNVTFFANLTFPSPGNYIVQTLIDSSLFREQLLPVGVIQTEEPMGPEQIH